MKRLSRLSVCVAFTLITAPNYASAAFFAYMPLVSGNDRVGTLLGWPPTFDGELHVDRKSAQQGPRGYQRSIAEMKEEFPSRLGIQRTTRNRGNPIRAFAAHRKHFRGDWLDLPAVLPR